MDESTDLGLISRKYGLPPMEYSRKLKPGKISCNRMTGRLLMSESFRSIGEAERLRAAFQLAGYYHTRSFERDVAPVISVIVSSATLVIVSVFPQSRALIPTPLLVFAWVAWLVSSFLVLVIRPAQWKREANRWAKEHWPARLRKKGVPYF